MAQAQTTGTGLGDIASDPFTVLLRLLSAQSADAGHEASPHRHHQRRPSRTASITLRLSRNRSTTRSHPTPKTTIPSAPTRSNKGENVPPAVPLRPGPVQLRRLRPIALLRPGRHILSQPESGTRAQCQRRQAPVRGGAAVAWAVEWAAAWADGRHGWLAAWAASCDQPG